MKLLIKNGLLQGKEPIEVRDQVIKIALDNDIRGAENNKYALTHLYSRDTEKKYFKTTLKPEAVHVLLAYIDYRGVEVDENYSLSIDILLNTLLKFYGEIDLLDNIDTKDDFYLIDAYLNREFFCGSGIENLEEFNREGLVDYLKEEIQKEINTIE